MKTLCVAMSSPESILMRACMGQLGWYLGLPTEMPMNLRDGKLLDAQAGFETGMGGAIGALSCDFLVSMQLDMDLTVDYADLVYSNECMRQLIRLVRPLHFDDETLAYENMVEVGHGKTFLETDHTIFNYQEEIWQPQIIERNTWESWSERGKKDIRQVAFEKATQMYHELENTEILPEDVRRAIDAIAENSAEKAKNIKR